MASLRGWYGHVIFRVFAKLDETESTFIKLMDDTKLEIGEEGCYSEGPQWAGQISWQEAPEVQKMQIYGPALLCGITLYSNTGLAPSR